MKKKIWKNPNNLNELEVDENCLIDNRTGERFVEDENGIIQFSSQIFNLFKKRK